jgi:hypothetical protein
MKNIILYNNKLLYKIKDYYINIRMGREYLGDISGKFGFCIQSSCDIESLININYTKEYEWYGCYCQIHEQDLNKEKYCKGCYECYEKHYKAVSDDIDKENNNLFFETTFILYNIIYDDHYDQLITSLNLIKEELPQDLIEEFEKIKDHEKIIDGYSDVFNEVNIAYDNHNNNDMLLYFLRYKLCMQIKYVLEREDNCFISCET